MSAGVAALPPEAGQGQLLSHLSCCCCPCCLQERYRGRAQIAFTGFQAPAVIAAELLVFTDSDALGLLWKRPVDSFSLFSRVSHMP